MNWKIPTIEEIYNEYHRQTFFIMNGVYPKSIKNFDSLYNDPIKTQHLLKFQEVLKRNRASIDWKLYILALAKVMKNRYDLKLLGSFGGNKIYRDYIKYLSTKQDTETEIYTTIISNLQFLFAFLKENELTFLDYFKEDAALIPLALKHIYSGTISVYFYACFPQHVIAKWLNYPDDVYYELFNLSKYEFLQTYIISKRQNLLTSIKIKQLIDMLEQKLNKYF